MLNPAPGTPPVNLSKKTKKEILNKVKIMRDLKCGKFKNINKMSKSQLINLIMENS